MINYRDLPLKNFLVIGSRAFNMREASDIDVIIYKKDILLQEEEYDKSYEHIYTFQWKGIRVECLLADNDESLQEILKIEEDTIRNLDQPIASYDTLLILKKGHICIPGAKWEKHISDYTLLRNLYWGHTVYNSTEFQRISELHRLSTEKRINSYKLPVLKNTTKDKFFKDNVAKYIDHDRIHEWMAIGEKPAYTKMQKPGEQVQCEKKLFEEMNYSEQVSCVMEESMVIACERVLIPKLMRGGFISQFTSAEIKNAFKWALMRVCTTLTSGWFREFAQNNYYEVLNSTPMNFPSKIKVEELDMYYMKKLKYEKNISN